MAANDDAAPIINLRGERVALGPLAESMLPLLTRWYNDFATNALSGDELLPLTGERVAADWTPLIRGGRPGWIGFAIYELPALRPIGMTNLRDLGSVHRTAEFGILIGERDGRGKGYGTETARLMLDYAFSALGVHNVWLDVVSANAAAVASYRRAGFQEIGRRREAHRIGNTVHDVILMDCLATEFERPSLPGWGMSVVEPPLISAERAP